MANKNRIWNESFVDDVLGLIFHSILEMQSTFKLTKHTTEIQCQNEISNHSRDTLTNREPFKQLNSKPCTLQLQHMQFLQDMYLNQ